jgi:hypothetical protein
MTEAGMKIKTRYLGLALGALLAVAAGCTGTAGGSACATACGTGQVCQAGQCVCSAGLLSCNGTCVASNAAHCGSCDMMCTGTDVCNAGSCQGMCPTGTTQCSDGSCVSPTGGDAMHCGGCNACPAGATCNAGVCSNVTGTGGAGGSSGTGGAGGGTVACTSLPAIPRRLWRLSAEQWGASVKDLLGLTIVPVPTNRGGEAAYAFFSDVTLGVDDQFQFALYQSSQNDVLPAIQSRIGVSGTTGLATCATGATATQQTACAMTFVQALGPKAFRRPLASAEVTDLMTVYAQGAMTDYATGIGLVVQALITSPSYLYRTELGPTTLTADASGNYPDTQLNPYEIASQLGFLFLGSLPDTALTAAAADGTIATPTGLNTQIDRLLTLPAVKANLTNIVIDWFNVRQMFDKGNKDTSLLTALATADRDQTLLTADLYTSTQQFVNDVLWTSGGTVNDLVTSQKVYMNKRLATLYPGATFAGGAPTSNTTFVLGTWPSSQGRSGMMTQPSFLWSASDPVKTSIVKRGKFIHDDVVCQDVLPPPIDLSTPQAMNVIACKSPDGTMSLSTCDSEVLQSDARMMYSPCKTCHASMDPYARVIQNFGPIGNYRTTDEAGRAIDPSYAFTQPPLAPMTISGSAAFGQALASTGIIKDCSVQKIASYATGSMIRTYNTCEVNDIRTQTDGTVGSLFKQVALANIMRARKGGAK